MSKTKQTRTQTKSAHIKIHPVQIGSLLLLTMLRFFLFSSQLLIFSSLQSSILQLILFFYLKILTMHHPFIFPFTSYLSLPIFIRHFSYMQALSWSGSFFSLSFDFSFICHLVPFALSVLTVSEASCLLRAFAFSVICSAVTQRLESLPFQNHISPSFLLLKCHLKPTYSALLFLLYTLLQFWLQNSNFQFPVVYVPTPFFTPTTLSFISYTLFLETFRLWARNYNFKYISFRVLSIYNQDDDDDDDEDAPKGDGLITLRGLLGREFCPVLFHKKDTQSWLKS